MRIDDGLINAARATPSGWAYLTSRGRSRKPPHVDLIDRKLCDLEQRRIRLLFLEMPPRHGKSYTSTEKFPGWYLGHHPDHRVGIIGYGANLAEMFGRKNRADVEEWGQRVFGISVDPRSAAVNNWNLAGRDGGLISVGLRGTITGRGFDLLIIDDPIKNHEEAESESYRDKLWELWSSTLRTRLEPGSVVLVIQTRWHEDDLAGRLQANPPKGWAVERLRLPALAEEPTADDPDYRDPLGRKPGEALWPERFDEDELRSIRSGGSYVWNALYQQRPVAAEGNVLRKAWWREYTDDPRRIAETCDHIIQSWDLAFKDSDGADRVAGQVWGLRGADMFLLDARADVLDFPDTCTAIRKMSADWPDATVKLIEDKANGPAVIATLRHDVGGLIPVEPQGGKMARVVAISGLVEAGNVYLPSRANAPWVGDFIAECAAFPNGANDDQVDAMSQALLRLKPGRGPQSARNIYSGGNTKHGQRQRKSRAEAYADEIPDED